MTGPIHQCMNKMSAIMTKAPQKLEALEKEMKDEMGEDAPMYQTIGRIAKMFMEQISQGTYKYWLFKTFLCQGSKSLYVLNFSAAYKIL